MKITDENLNEPLVSKISGTNYFVTISDPTIRGYKAALEALENSMGHDADGSEYVFTEIQKQGNPKLIAHVTKHG
jgi:low affinity Fe/Cu permease